MVYILPFFVLNDWRLPNSVPGQVVWARELSKYLWFSYRFLGQVLWAIWLIDDLQIQSLAKLFERENSPNTCDSVNYSLTKIFEWSDGREKFFRIEKSVQEKLIIPNIFMFYLYIEHENICVYGCKWCGLYRQATGPCSSTRLQSPTKLQSPAYLFPFASRILSRLLHRMSLRSAAASP